MLAFAAVLGVGYGGFVALAPAVVAARFGVANLGAVLGALYTGPGLVAHGRHLGGRGRGRYDPATMTRSRTSIPCAIIIIATSA